MFPQARTHTHKANDQQGKDSADLLLQTTSLPQTLAASTCWLRDLSGSSTGHSSSY